MPFPGFRTKRNGKHPFTNRQSIFHKIRSTPSAQAPPLPNHLLDDTSFLCSHRSRLPFHHAGCYEWVEKDPLFCGQRVVVTRFAFACIAERRILPYSLIHTLGPKSFSRARTTRNVTKSTYVRGIDPFCFSPPNSAAHHPLCMLVCTAEHPQKTNVEQCGRKNSARAFPNHLHCKPPLPSFGLTEPYSTGGSS